MSPHSSLLERSLRMREVAGSPLAKGMWEFFINVPSQEAMYQYEIVRILIKAIVIIVLAHCLRNIIITVS